MRSTRVTHCHIRQTRKASNIMALKIVLLALLVYCAASEAQSQGDDTSLPLSYDVTELQGDGATCPNDQLRQENIQNITSDVRNLLQNSVLPRLNGLPQCPCISGGGTRIANLDMTDPNQQCPPEWTLITSPVRTCGRTSASGCDSVIFPANGATYSRVCGRVKAYQIGSTEAFRGYNDRQRTTIDSSYVDGVVITLGAPTQHVWTFAAAFYEQYTGLDADICACTNTNNSNAATLRTPPFVGNDYFCDTGTVTNPTGGTQFFPDDPLWDGEGCGPTSTCCELNNPPWFCKQLPAPTSDDIEVRLCLNYRKDNEDIGIEQIEIYIV